MIRQKFRTLNRRGNRTAHRRLSLMIPLYTGESFKLVGNVFADDRFNSDWNAQLLQYGMVVGSAGGGTSFDSNGNNLLITVPATANYGVNPNQYPAQYGQPYGQQYGQPYTQPYGQPYTQPYGQQYGQCGPGLGQCVPNTQAGVGYQQTYSSQIPVPQSFELDLFFSGQVTLEARGFAIGCEDGRGNSYPCP
jgi:hypothetical protein